MCETPSWRLKPRPLSPTLHKYLYLWSDHRSDHRTKDMRWLLYKFRIIAFFFFPNINIMPVYIET